MQTKEQLANPSQVEQILTGWGNLIKSAFVDLDKDLKDLSSKRLIICDGCHMRNGGTCNPSMKGKHVVTGVETTGCGCRLSAKTLSPGSTCPLGKW
jgi:hypothetical protein